MLLCTFFYEISPANCLFYEDKKLTNTARASQVHVLVSVKVSVYSYQEES